MESQAADGVLFGMSQTPQFYNIGLVTREIAMNVK